MVVMIRSFKPTLPDEMMKIRVHQSVVLKEEMVNTLTKIRIRIILNFNSSMIGSKERKMSKISHRKKAIPGLIDNTPVKSFHSPAMFPTKAIANKKKGMQVIFSDTVLEIEHSMGGRIGTALIVKAQELPNLGATPACSAVSERDGTTANSEFEDRALFRMLPTKKPTWLLSCIRPLGFRDVDRSNTNPERDGYIRMNLRGVLGALRIHRAFTLGGRGDHSRSHDGVGVNGTSDKAENKDNRS
uniref:Uncharacterized protein n=1 Tax=Cannabis sativa TaxID=3483 RepID=A0A803PIJ9_CANSA